MKHLWKGLRFALVFKICLAVPAVALPTSPIRPGDIPPTATYVQPVAVFGADNRSKIPLRYRDLGSRIGILYHPQANSACTAFCINSSTIMTAAHCLYRTNDEKPPQLQNFMFRFNARQPTPSSRIMGAQSRAAAQHVMVGTTSLSVRPPIDATRDWAVIRLAQPICPTKGLRLSGLSPKEVEERASQDAMYQIAYHRDFGNWDLALGRNCQLQKGPTSDNERAPIVQDFTQSDNLILHQCDTGGASSGSPMFINGTHGPEVVAINVGTYIQSRIKTLNGEVLKRFKSDEIANTAVATAAFSSQVTEFLKADLLAAPSDIRRLQTLLTAQGLYLAKIDGLYGMKLRDAIKSYEHSAALPVTGIASRKLLRRLENAKPPKSTAQATTN